MADLAIILSGGPSTPSRRLRITVDEVGNPPEQLIDPAVGAPGLWKLVLGGTSGPAIYVREHPHHTRARATPEGLRDAM